MSPTEADSPNRKSARISHPALDEVDARLLTTLHANGRTSQEELSRVLSLSRAAVRERMRRLESSGVLRGYTIDLDWELLGYPFLAFVRVRLDNMDCATATQQVVTLSCNDAVIESCHAITGDWSLFIRVRARTSSALEKLLERICTAPACASTATELALSSLYER